MLLGRVVDPSATLVLCVISIMCTAASSAQVDSLSYVGGDACASCHPVEAQRWTGSHHDLAMQPANDATVKGDFDNASFTHRGITTRFFRRDQKFFVHTEGSDGQMADFEVSYTFGVDPLQQYLIGFPDGRFQTLGVAWDDRPGESGGQRWYSLYPDEIIPHDDVLHWTQPSQNWNHMCAACHSTNLRKGYLAASDTFETRWSEIDVSCEACHGPGSKHRDLMKARDPVHEPVGSFGKAQKGESGLTIAFPRVAEADWTIDPNTGNPVRKPERVDHLEVEVCARCHSRRSEFADGVPPGRPLQDGYRVATLEAPLYYPDGQIKDEVYVYGSFIQSAMYAAGVTCSDCHDPHSGSLRAEENNLCTRCHTAGLFDVPQHHHHAKGSAGAQCVECHMPSRTYMGVDERHDHSIRVPRPDLSEALGTPNACNRCHASMTSSWAAKKVEAWFGEGRRRKPHWGSAIHAARSNALDAEARLLGMLNDPQIPGIARATAISLLPRFASPRSMPVFSQLIGDEDPLVRTAALEALEGFPPELRVALAASSLADPIRSVRFESARILASVSDAQLGTSSPQLHAVLSEFRDALDKDADRAEPHMQLGAIALARGQLDSAQKEYELARTRNPSFVPAYVNLADLHRIRGKDNEGEKVLRAALEIVPDQPDVRHALGLLLVRLDRLDEALIELEFAAQERPGNPRYAYVLAVALHTAGEIDRARSVLRKASAEHPADRDLRAFLANLERRE